MNLDRKIYIEFEGYIAGYISRDIGEDAFWPVLITIKQPCIRNTAPFKDLLELDFKEEPF